MIRSAGGTIPTSVFVKVNPSADREVVVADLNAVPYGISGEGGKYAPIPSVTTDPPTHAEAGDPCVVMNGHSGDRIESGVLLRLGGTVARGAFVMPNASGLGIAATTGKYYGAIAEESGVSGDVVTVTPVLGLMA